MDRICCEDGQGFYKLFWAEDYISVDIPRPIFEGGEWAGNKALPDYREICLGSDGQVEQINGVPLGLPSADPSTLPSRSPSKAPSGSPSVSQFPSWSPSAFDCTNNPHAFRLHNGKETSCDKVAALPNLAPNNKRNKRCKQNIIRENCPGLCQKKKCLCEDFPIPFQWGHLFLTCDSVAQLSKENQKKSCKRRKYQNMCPSVCDKRCRA